MLPKPKNHPPFALESLVDHQIPPHVRFELSVPEITIGFGFGSVLWASVPETSVNKHGDLLRPKDKIRTDETSADPHGNVSSPPFDAISAHGMKHSNLGCLVALGAYPGHDVGSLPFGKHVHRSSFQMQDLDLMTAEAEEYLEAPEKEEYLLKQPVFLTAAEEGVWGGLEHPHPELFCGLYIPFDSPGPTPVTDEAAICSPKKRRASLPHPHILVQIFTQTRARKHSVYFHSADISSIQTFFCTTLM
jgi:hypothetical protein